MKRDLDLIRSILLHIESIDSEPITCETIAEALGVEAEIISHHITLLVDCDYLDVTNTSVTSCSFKRYQINRITFFGYEYLDSVRDEKIYRDAKCLLKAFVSVPLEAIKQTASLLIQEKIKSLLP